MPRAINAEPITLRVESYAGPNHTVNTNAWPEWIRRVEEASGGEIKIQITYPPVDPRLLLDRVTSGIGDITWSSSNYTTGRFILAEIADLPNLGGTAEQRATAYWRTHQKYLTDADEFKNVKLLGLFSHGPGMLHTREPVASINELKGRKIRMSGNVLAEITKRLGVVGVGAPVSKANEMLSSGVVDGTLFSLETITSFKLDDTVKYHYDFPNGLYSSGFFAVMNKAKFDKLPPKQKQAIESVSGELLASIFGQAWDTADKAAASDLTSKGNTLVSVSGPFAEQVMAAVQPIEEQWIERAKGVGLKDPVAALSYFREQVKAQGSK
jgi:TRAP-type C4-dicarboxylate transport system substrate-binding protein